MQRIYFLLYIQVGPLAQARPAHHYGSGNGTVDMTSQNKINRKLFHRSFKGLQALWTIQVVSSTNLR